MALFQVILHHALGILSASLRLQAGIETLATLTHLGCSTFGVQNTGSCLGKDQVVIGALLKK